MNNSFDDKTNNNKHNKQNFSLAIAITNNIAIIIATASTSNS